jgi:3-ketosteroid 9alpha-monooxygenase subunit A
MSQPSGNGNHRNFPYTSQPTGWFQLGWSQDFPAGVVVPLRYFGQELVAYRGASGSVHLFDAYCPHLGAHLGYGGKVDGDDIVCPFHAWRFDCEGCNIDIPYSARKSTANRLRRWHVREELGVVYFWHDENGIAPRWDPPRPVEDPATYYPVYPEGTKTWTVRMFPQLVPENAVDFSHFGVTHGATPTPRLLSVDAGEFCFKSQLGMMWGGKAEKTWLTPDGPVDGILQTEIYGMGVSIARFLGTDGTVSLVGVTPSDGEQLGFPPPRRHRRRMAGDRQAPPRRAVQAGRSRSPHLGAPALHPEPPDRTGGDGGLPGAAVVGSTLLPRRTRLRSVRPGGG